MSLLLLLFLSDLRVGQETETSFVKSVVIWHSQAFVGFLEFPSNKSAISSAPCLPNCCTCTHDAPWMGGKSADSAAQIALISPSNSNHWEWRTISIRFLFLFRTVKLFANWLTDTTLIAPLTHYNTVYLVNVHMWFDAVSPEVGKLSLIIVYFCNADCAGLELEIVSRR